MNSCLLCDGEVMTDGFFNHRFGCLATLTNTATAQWMLQRTPPDSPPPAPEEAVRLVDALLHAADDKAPVFEKRRALLNYMDKQHAEVEETRESWRIVQKMCSALTAEKEAMQKVVGEARRLSNGHGHPSFPVCSCQLCSVIDSTERK